MKSVERESAAPKLTSAEIVEQLRRAIRGEISVTVDGERTWDEAYCGNVDLLFGDWKITAYNDCYEFDYLDRVTSPDGRTADFAAMNPGPVEMLTQLELATLEGIVGKAHAKTK
jgi:hypothetical protein